MKWYIAYLYLFLLCLFTACGTSPDKNDRLSSTQSPSEEEPIGAAPPELSSQFTIKEGDFNFTLFNKQETYEANEEPEIYAELMYTGKKELIEITHSEPLIIFSLHELTRNVKLDMLIREVAITRTLAKNEPILNKFDIKKSFMHANHQKSQQFYDEAKQNGLPHGDYIINTHALFFVKDDKDYNLQGVIKFKIKK